MTQPVTQDGWTGRERDLASREIPASAPIPKAASLRGQIDNGIRSGLEKGMRKSVPGIVDTVLASLWDHPAYPVIVGGQLRLMETGMKPSLAWKMSRDVVAEFLKDEGVKVGDKAYDWSPDAGRTLVEEYEIEHWDVR